MYSDIAISVKNLTKTYRIFGHPSDRIKHALSFGKITFHREFTALQDISFEIKKGESVGIIGRNGSGKSTLLQLICGILKPTSGEVKVNGRICALLELGSGFNPEFTGRENIYFQGAVMGLTKHQMDERIDNIISFANIGEFIDQPLRTYSSGMSVRLAFAVIAHVDANILVIDEALSVGDIFFQQKCMRYLHTFKKRGGTTLFVSHDTSAVIGLCEHAILLSNVSDERLILGDAKTICQIYVEQLYSARTPTDTINVKKTYPEETTSLAVPQKEIDRTDNFLAGDKQQENIITATCFRHDAESFGRGGAKIIDVWFEDETESRVLMVNGGSFIKLCIKVKALENIQFPAFGFMIKNHLGQFVFAEGTDLAYRQLNLTIISGDTWIVQFSFSMPILIQGNYSINVAVAEGMGEDHIQHHWIEDAMSLQSIQSRLVHGVCGLQNLSIRIEKYPVNRAHL